MNMTENVIEIPFEPISVEVDGNDFILPNKAEAHEFIKHVEKHKNFGFGAKDFLELVMGEDVKVEEVRVYTDATEAFNDYILL